MFFPLIYYSLFSSEYVILCVSAICFLLGYFNIRKTCVLQCKALVATWFMFGSYAQRHSIAFILLDCNVIHLVFSFVFSTCPYSILGLMQIQFMLYSMHTQFNMFLQSKLIFYYYFITV